MLVVAFRGTKSTRQRIDEFRPIYFNTAFEDLWQCMEPKVKALVSKNLSYQIWVKGHSLAAALASLASVWLAYYNIAPRQNITF